MSEQPRDLKSSSEDALKHLVNYDVVILMDDSGSMGYQAGPHKRRWDLAMEVMEKVTEIAMEYDTNGIEIQFLNSKNGRNVKSAADVKSLFEQVELSSGTPLGERLDDICRDHLRKLNSRKRKLFKPLLKPLKRCLIIAITDGAPNDVSRVYSTIQYAASELHASHTPLTQLGIQFVQIGNDHSATTFLKKLDDEFGDRDIVDTVPYKGVDLTPEEMVKILVGAINRRVDNQE